jgi:Spy/CpxP family protein refolding chaperone
MLDGPPPPRGPEMDRGGSPGIQPPPRGGLQLTPPGRWWDEKRVIKRLSLSPEQQHKMDEIFEANKPKLQALLSNLQAEQAHLANLSPEERQDEAKVFAAIDRVTQAHADLEKADAHLELQIRRQLDASQLAQLDRDLVGLRPE